MSNKALTWKMKKKIGFKCRFHYQEDSISSEMEIKAN